MKQGKNVTKKCLNKQQKMAGAQEKSNKYKIKDN